MAIKKTVNKDTTRDNVFFGMNGVLFIVEEEFRLVEKYIHIRHFQCLQVEEFEYQYLTLNSTNTQDDSITDISC